MAYDSSGIGRDMMLTPLPLCYVSIARGYMNLPAEENLKCQTPELGQRCDLEH